MKTRKINKTIVGLLAASVILFISSMIIIPSEATETTENPLIKWGEAEDPQRYTRDGEASTWYTPLDGYLFAGWYETTESEEAISDISKYETAYPKYVREDVLTVKFQVALKNGSNQYTSSDTVTAKVDLRILTSVDSLQYQRVTFLLGSTEKEHDITDVYKEVIGGSDTYYPSDVCTAFGDGEGYIVATHVENMDSYVKEVNGELLNSFERTILVTPRWTTMDGTVVTGELRTTKITDAKTSNDSTIGDCEAVLTYDDGTDTPEILWYKTLASAVAKVQELSTDVTIDVRKNNAKLPAHVARTSAEDTTYTLNGHGYTLDASTSSGSLFQIQNVVKRNLVVKNATINHGVTSTSKFMAINNNNIVITFEDVTINSTSTNTSEGLFYISGNGLKRTINMTNVTINWTPTGKIGKALFHFYQQGQIININATNTTITVNNSVPVIYITGANGSTLNLTTNDATSKASLYGSTGEKIGDSANKSTINFTDNTAQ